MNKKVSDTVLIIFLLFPITGLITLFFLGIKILNSFQYWLKFGNWKFIGYKPSCEYFEFNCYPDTSYVKIDEFLWSFYHIDNTFFILICGFIVFIIFGYLFGGLMSDDISHLK